MIEATCKLQYLVCLATMFMAASSSFSMDGTLKLLDGTREQDFVFFPLQRGKKKTT
jgi:hypothetical protein